MKRKILSLAALAVIAIGGAYLIAANTKPIPTIAPLVTEQNGIKADLKVSPEEPRAGEKATLTFHITDTEGNPVSLTEHHARRVHTLVVSEDLSSFGHIHPTDFSLETDELLAAGMHPVEYTFPAAGRYIVGVDVMGDSGTLAAQFLVNVEGSPKQARVPEDVARTKMFVGLPEQGNDRYVDPVHINDTKTTAGGYTVTFSLTPEEPRAGEEVELRFRVEKDGTPVEDLAPYLDAALHLALVPASFDNIIHAHGYSDDRADGDADSHGEGAHDEEEEEGHVHKSHLPESFGPKVSSESLVFPTAGVWQVFGVVKHEGKLIVMDFLVEIEESVNLETATVANLAIAERALLPQTVTVNQNDDVVLRVSTDEAGEFHIAGYEIVKNVSAGSVTEIIFRAANAGRYNLEFHPSTGGHEDDEHGDEGESLDLELGALIVQPQ